MRVTPLEIRQKSFEKVFRGYDKEEVDAFLRSLSSEWEKVIDESKELKFRLAAAEKEVEKLREVENSLFKTLKTAEDTGANIKEQANKEAEIILREAQMEAGKIVGQAQMEASRMVNEAEERVANMNHELKQKSHQFSTDVEEEIKSMMQHYRAIDGMGEDFISELKGNLEDLQLRIGKMDFKKREIRKKHELLIAGMEKIQSKLAQDPTMEQLKATEKKEEDSKITDQPDTFGVPEIEQKKTKPEAPKKDDHNQGGDSSFFDDL
ncbi:DivIVA domain-containing protein [Persicobacter sp. CCB-QB2]|uniref:DivIVA domain-containing protein n=1 Tax=Persicobacter sp. CCB-QB2 TaxID=1561025 RepID=UPI0006A98D8F|nr:DivIVA domain-containing protein [Persicobacter sp. CCB-QB2]